MMISRIRLAGAICAVAVVAPQSAFSQDDNGEGRVEGSQPLNLICVGGGNANKAASVTMSGSHSGTAHGSGGGFATYNGTSQSTIYGTRSQDFEDQVRIRLDDGDDRLRMPGSMLPLIRGGDNGWFKLKNVKYSSDEITGSVAVNVLNNPKLRLDRYTGAISISGKAGNYTGQCTKISSEAVDRAF